jgi:hypothetical protein
MSEFTVSSKDAEKAIKEIKGVCGTDHISFYEEGGKLKMSGSKDNKTLILTLHNSQVSKGIKFSVQDSLLLGILKNRGTLSFSQDKKGTIVEFKAEKGPYKGDFAPLAFEDHKVSVDSDAKRIKLTIDAQKALDKVLSMTRIMDIYGTFPISLRLLMDGKSITGLCYDQLHIARCRVEVPDAPKLKGMLNISIEAIDLINKQANSKNYKLTITPSFVHAANEDFEVFLPLIQAEEEQKLDVHELVDNNLKVKPTAVVKVEVPALTSCLENAMAVYDTGKPISLSIGKKSIATHIKTNFGQVLDSVKVKVVKPSKEKFEIDPYLLSDLIGLIPNKKPVKLTFVGGKFLHVVCSGKGTEAAYVGTLL